MKTSVKFLLFRFSALVVLALSLSAENTPLILPTEDPETGPPMRVVWPTEPGIRYELQESTTLEPDSWTTVAGFPTEAAALAQQHAFELDVDKKFYRVVELDEQPPEVVDYSPGDGAFGVGRFSSISVELEDRTGIDAASISLSVGGAASIGTADPSLTFEDGVLTFDLGGDTPLGAYGETLDFQLTVADSLGNTETYQWSMELERLVQTASDLLVFGSPDAQRAGQRLSGMAATVAARFGGPVRASGTSLDWEIDSVTADSILIAYTSPSPPTFTVGQKVTNLAPAHVDEIFYREITSVSVDTGAATVTLDTVDLALTDFITDGSFTFGQGGTEILEFDESGNLVAMRSVTFDLISVGADLSGQTVYGDGSLELNLSTARALFSSSLTLSGEIENLQVKRFEARVNGSFDMALDASLSASTSDPFDSSQELWADSFWVWGNVSGVPVGVELTGSISVNSSGFISAEGLFETGFSRTASIALGGKYVRDATPAVTWDRPEIDPGRIETEPFGYDVTVEAEASASLVPQLDVRLYGLGGIYLNTDPQLTLAGAATVAGGEITQASWLCTASADLNAGLSIIGFENSDLPTLGSHSLFSYSWSEEIPKSSSLEFVKQPEGATVTAGQPFSMAALASGPSDNIQYEWRKDGELNKFGGNQRVFPSIQLSDAGDYQVVARSDGQTAVSETATVTVVPPTGPVPAGMVRVAGGTLAMSMGTVSVDTFDIGRHEVTWGEWQTVRTWAAANGYDIGSRGAGCADNHPVHSVAWYDVVKWCNAKTEMEGLTPVYRYNGSTYRNGEPDHTTISQNLSASGYRLPQEAEWEFAARGGNQTNGYTFSGSSDLNAVGWYRDNSGGAACDLYPGKGTWPVGQKAANELGLYDMSGNVWEWCWDQNGSYRRVRGGSWILSARKCTVSNRSFNDYPYFRYLSYGFRLARSSGN